MTRRQSVCVSLRVTFDAELDAPFLERLAKTPRGRRAGFIRDLIRSTYAGLAGAGSGPWEDAEGSNDSWLDYIAAEDDDL